ncbi:MAG: DUF2147 domain-containing protein [Pseudomonadota bacterium]
MKTFIAAALLVLGPAIAHAADVEGTWATETNEDGNYLEVTVHPCPSDGAKMCGTIDRAMGPSGPQPGYEHEGRQMISDMEPNGANRYANGKIWAPDTDKTYSSNMQLNGNVLTVKGCVLFICRGQDWSRVN